MSSTTGPALYLPPAAQPPDPEWTETLRGGHALIVEGPAGHALVVEYGDCSFAVTCQCGRTLAPDVRPDRFGAAQVTRWGAHVEQLGARAAVTGAHCQCGRVLAGACPAGRPPSTRWWSSFTTIPAEEAAR